jgi:hypothetical protein
MYAWEPPAAPQMTEQTIPEGVRIYLDGELLARVPQTPGMHLAQRRTGDGWTTLLMRDGEIPSGWFDEPSLLARRGVDKSLVVALFGGLGSTGQSVDQPGSYLDSVSEAGMAIGAHLQGSVGIAAGPGLYIDAAFPSLVGLGAIGAHGGLGWVLGPVQLQAGGGIQQVGASAGDERLVTWHPFPTLGARLAVGEGTRLDATIHAGSIGILTRVQGGAGVTLGPGFRAGLDVLTTSSAWEQTNQSRDISAREMTAGLTLGWTLGAR